MKVKLETFLREITEKTTINNQYPVLTSSKSGLYLQSDYFNKQVASKDNTGYKIIRKGQFTYRAMSDTGEFFPNMLECAEIGIVSPAYPVFEIVDTSLIVPEYLKYFFKSDVFQYSIASFVQGSTRTSVKFGKLKTISMELPDKEKQNQIIEILNATERIIERRKEELQQLDELVKARFVELFGDIKINNFNVKTAPMTDICEIIDGDRGKNYPKQDEFFEEGFCLFLNAKNVTSNGFDFSNCMYISKEKDEILRKGKLTRGDVILTTRGTIGNLAYYSDDIPFENIRINSGMVILRMNHKIVDEIFFIEQFKLQLEDIKRKIASGSAQPQLPISTMNKINMIVPPINEQKYFSEFVKQVDKSKFVEQKINDIFQFYLTV